MAILSRTLERPLTQRISRAAHVQNIWLFIHDHDLASLDNSSVNQGPPIPTISGLPLAGDLGPVMHYKAEGSKQELMRVV